MFCLDLVTCQLSVLFILEINNKENKTMSYYVWIGVCPNKSAYDLYQEYIRASDGYCHDELQEETDFTWTIFTRVDYDDWFDYPYHLRYQKQMVNGKERIVKSEYKTAAEVLHWKSMKIEHKHLADAVEDCMADTDEEDFSDHEDSEYDDLYCYERIN